MSDSPELKIISLGGSIIAPDGVDAAYLKDFRELLLQWLDGAPGRRAVLICGGGAPARVYQEAYRQVMAGLELPGSSDEQDWIGIAATRLNARLVQAVFGDECPHEVVTDPSAVRSFQGRVLVAAGWKPGFSTDFDAVVLAENFGSRSVINLSNITKVYSADPKEDPSAQPLDHMTWDQFRRMVGTTWTPGKNTPFDPVASTRAAELDLHVVVANGRNLPNLKNILEGRDFEGSTIHGRES